ncbi:MAG TPA: NAD-dependent epimerase/dehydratase family protein [Polyangiaceae bacterium]|nr:NAD-dependent epimerase/dehydratase family protein [Polyangiaceae bacterium]
MKYRVLITGGAGFIGSRLADALLSRGYAVRVLDVLSPHVHGRAQQRPPRLSSDVDLCVGDVRDARAVARALEGVDAVFHLAALCGVNPSMYKVHDYVDVNARGTAVLLEGLARRPVRKLIVGSSMSVYGEGQYQDADGRVVCAGRRSASQLKRSEWELSDASGAPLQAVATPEYKVPAPESIYALSKFHQEQQCLIAGRAYDIPTTVLRFSTVYGPGQTVNGAHSGVMSMFASRFATGRAPLIYEDGLQKRDFITVDDAAEACALTLTEPKSDGLTINIGSGEGRTILDVASRLAVALGKTPAAEVSGRYRLGEVRHCFADIALARDVLGFSPRVSFEEGIEEFAASVQSSWKDEDGALEDETEVRFGGLS